MAKTNATWTCPHCGSDTFYNPELVICEHCNASPVPGTPKRKQKRSGAMPAPIIDEDHGRCVMFFPLPTSMNRESANRWAKQTLKKLWERKAQEEWVRAYRPRFERCTFKPTFCFPDNRRRDIHNYLGGTSMKGLVDGFVGHMIPDDDHTRLQWLEPVVEVGGEFVGLKLEIIDIPAREAGERGRDEHAQTN